MIELLPPLGPQGFCGAAGTTLSRVDAVPLAAAAMATADADVAALHFGACGKRSFLRFGACGKRSFLHCAARRLL